MPPRRSARAVSGASAPAAAPTSSGAGGSKSAGTKPRAVSGRRKAATPSPDPSDQEDGEEGDSGGGEAHGENEDEDGAFPGESDEEPVPPKRSTKPISSTTTNARASRSSATSTKAPMSGKTVPKKRVSEENVEKGSKKAPRVVSGGTSKTTKATKTRTSAAASTTAAGAGRSKRAGESISDDSSSPRLKKVATKARSGARGVVKGKGKGRVVSEESEEEEDHEDEAEEKEEDGVEEALTADEEEAEDEEEEETLKAKGVKGNLSGKKDAVAEVTAAKNEEDEDEEEKEDEDATPAPTKASAAAAPAQATSDDEAEATDTEDVEATPSKSKPVSKGPKAAPGTPARVRAEAEEEDEHANSTPDFAHIPHPTAARPFPSPSPARVNSETLAPSQASQATPMRVPSTPAVPFAPPPVAKPKARLTIHKLVLVNFKSYAGRQEIGPFHKSFSAIVGPNGSGKSNTIDALLFVFGYRASKMRQGKLSELIHNSAGKEGLESCSVEVWFREIVDMPGVDNFKLVPNSQLVVTRTAYRNNSSNYSINDMKSTFGEVTTLLKGKGIDLDHNRFLILQGEVESIAQMKAKAGNEHEDGLLEYLEDIIGTTKYKEPIEEASKAVEELNDKRGEKMNRLRVVETEKKALEAKKKEAEDYLRDTNELVRKKSLLWQFHMHTLRANLEMTAKAIDTLTAKLTDEQTKNAGLLADIERLTAEYNEKLAAYQEVQRLTDALVKDAKKFEKEEVGLQERKKHQVTKQKKLKKSIADDTHAKSEAVSAIDNHSAELATNRTKVTKLEKKLEDEEAELEEIRESLKDKTDQFTVQIEAKQRELEPWTAKINEKQSSIDVAKSERDALVEKASGQTTALQEAKDNLEKLLSGGEGKQGELENYKAELKTAKRDLAQAEAKLGGMSDKAEDLKRKATNARGKADEAKSSMAADRSENAVLTSLNKLKAQGRIKGFHGRLGDLGTIDDKYDVAVTTACGALNNLVVDTVEQGQACIEHLRKGNVGRASFMVLEKLPARDLGKIQTPENVPRLFDLIKPKDPRFAPAFYKGVFNTLVAEDLVQAQRIGYGAKRWRVVTLAGQLIDPSGTMSGGGTRVQRGGMSSKLKADSVGPEVVMRYEQERDTAEAEYMEYIRDRKKVDEEVQRLRGRVPEIEVEIEKIGLDVSTGEKRVREAEKRLAEVKAQSKPDAADEKRIKTLSAEIDSLEAEVAKLKSKSSGISDQIKELQNKILEVGGVKLRAIQSKVTTTKGLLDLANESITKAEVGQAKSERDVEKLTNAVEANKVKLEEVERELEAVETDLKAAQADRAAIQEKVQEAKDANEEVKEGLEESRKELEEGNESINAFRKLEVDIGQKIGDHQRAQKDNKKRLEHYMARHDELKLDYIDEDDEDEDEEEPEQADQAEGEVDGEAAEGADGVPAQPKRVKKRTNDSMELVEYSADELREVDKEMLNAEITQLEEETGRAKPNLNVLAEYRKREAEFLNRASDMEATTNERDAAKKRYDELRKVRLDEFMAGFSAISSKLKEMYQMITMGGNAEIELIDSMDPFSEGVVLSIMPPKKSWRAIANLSGGEKTLASLALVFALHVFKPTPLYFMDEIDAALDFKNVSIVANYIQSKTQAAQFIVISLRNDMFELAHRLVGIYKTSNCTKSVAIDNKDLRTQAVPRPRRPLIPGTSPEKRLNGRANSGTGGQAGASGSGSGQAGAGASGSQLAPPGTVRKLSATPTPISLFGGGEAGTPIGKAAAGRAGSD